jgi:hypothetical protein
MVTIRDEWLLALGTVALIGSLLVSELPLTTVALVAIALVAVDLLFVAYRNGVLGDATE